MKIILIFLILTLTSIQCNGQEKDSTRMQKKPIDQVIKDRQEMLMAIPGVQGFYQGQTENGGDCIVIMIDSLTEVNRDKLPDSLDGYPVRIEAGGEVKPLRH